MKLSLPSQHFLTLLSILTDSTTVQTTIVSSLNYSCNSKVASLFWISPHPFCSPHCSQNDSFGTNQILLSPRLKSFKSTPFSQHQDETLPWDYGGLCTISSVLHQPNPIPSTTLHSVLRTYQTFFYLFTHTIFFHLRDFANAVSSA